VYWKSEGAAVGEEISSEKFPAEFVWFEVVEIGEPAANALRIVVAESIARELQTEIVAPGVQITAHPMTVGEDSRIFEILWDYCVSYMVTNESYCLPEKGKPIGGGAISEWQISEYLSFVRSSTFAETIRDKVIRHWRLATQNHIVDVAAFEPPQIRRLAPYEIPKFDSGNTGH
jgi:hypothetical protein